ncbi:uridine kinase family protein [Coccidioides posadasii C735 delta SOWgp]|uniref:Uridine kinase n=3 Tax=Coccidioides posadasii TaxID=199306 RepID=E9DCZ2_COCPS|nr:uridine kinase family protein [Coccidioides posadasii C735 delta SOWgp]EER24178.1 uridine kinase family protein [Coccidioides posadasii C735 delta SOWgp]EFW15517.1 uridine kinase [Coccidioides posadasii str. Silveira]KMM65792.1 uridine kinase [Coccidioides posadasii RMSCC 3488]|eukprot:XP_003066323.1 uridine kinase family protein [Coccidioides posadasii C735 delta SOWgp]
MAETKSRCSRPWEDMSIIGIAGGSGSGKSSVAAEIIKSLNLPGAVILVMDHFYKSLTPEQNAIAHQDEYDFDSPDAIDFDVLVQTLQNLKQGLKVEIPIYSFTKHQREEATVSLYPPRVLILEGILAFTDPRIVDMLDIKIFVEADMDVCLGRRIARDVRERGRTLESVLKQWFKFVKPSYNRFVEPQRQISDIIVPRGIENKTAIDMVVKHIHRIITGAAQRHNPETRPNYQRRLSH